MKDNKAGVCLGAALLGIALAAFLEPRPASAASAGNLDRDVTVALNSLYQRYPAAKSLSKDAKAILVFPKIRKVGLMIGGESGDGALRVKGLTVAHYNTSGLSYGLQIGAQSYGYALFMMTDAAVGALDKADGFEIGVGPSVVVMDDGLARKATTTTVKSDIYAFIFGQKGLMAGIGIQGSKITRIDKR